MNQTPGDQDNSGPAFIAPEHPAFSGFIFKIQAAMDPKHRDRIAFIRVCSGKFERDMTVHHSGSEKKVRLPSSHKIFGNERETVNEAFPGDVIGLVGHDSFGIGDTLTSDPTILYKEIPRLTPEAFSYLHNPNTAKYKQFRQGLEQLLQEGVIQALYLRNSSVKTPLLAAVGPLQFEVVQFRLENEYGAVSRLESAPWAVVRWMPTDMKEDDLDALSLPTGSRIAYDAGKNPVVLFPNEWSANYSPAQRSVQAGAQKANSYHFLCIIVMFLVCVLGPGGACSPPSRRKANTGGMTSAGIPGCHRKKVRRPPPRLMLLQARLRLPRRLLRLARFSIALHDSLGRRSHPVNQSLGADDGGVRTPTEYPLFDLLEVVEVERHPHGASRQIDDLLARMPAPVTEHVRRPSVQVDHHLVVPLAFEDAEAALQVLCNLEIDGALELSRLDLRLAHARKHEDAEGAPPHILPHDIPPVVGANKLVGMEGAHLHRPGRLLPVAERQWPPLLDGPHDNLEILLVQRIGTRKPDVHGLAQIPQMDHRVFPQKLG